MLYTFRQFIIIKYIITYNTYIKLYNFKTMPPKKGKGKKEPKVDIPAGGINYIKYRRNERKNSI